MSNRGEAMLDELLSGSLLSGRFGHKEHLAVTVSAIERFGPVEAELILRGAIRSSVAKAGFADKYNDTITRFWCGAVGHAMADLDRPVQVDQILSLFPTLGDKAAPLIHWSAAVLGGPWARQGWIEPDLAQLPWAVAPS